MYYFGKSEEYMDLSRIYLAVHIYTLKKSATRFRNQPQVHYLLGREMAGIFLANKGMPPGGIYRVQGSFLLCGN